MPHVRDEDDDVQEHDPEGPDPSEMDYSEESDLDVCPHCRKLIYEDAERCPHCGNHISAQERPLPKAAWYVIIVIALIVLVLLFMRM